MSARFRRRDSAGGTGTLRVYGIVTKPLRAQMAAVGYSPADITYPPSPISTGTCRQRQHVRRRHLLARSSSAMSCSPTRQALRTEPANFSALKIAKT